MLPLRYFFFFERQSDKRDTEIFHWLTLQKALGLFQAELPGDSLQPEMRATALQVLSRPEVKLCLLG